MEIDERAEMEQCQAFADYFFRLPGGWSDFDTSDRRLELANRLYDTAAEYFLELMAGEISKTQGGT